MNWKLALRALRNLCAFIGAIALFSYFANFAVDLRHWYLTIASAFVCAILWLGFYVIEVRGGITQVALRFSRLRATSRTKSAELPSPAEPLSGDPPATWESQVESQETTPPSANPLASLRKAEHNGSDLGSERTGSV